MVTSLERAKCWLDNWKESDDRTLLEESLSDQFNLAWDEGERLGKAGRDPFLAKVDDRRLEEVCLRILEAGAPGYLSECSNGLKAYDRMMALRRRAAEILLSGLPKGEEPPSPASKFPEVIGSREIEMQIGLDDTLAVQLEARDDGRQALNFLVNRGANMKFLRVVGSLEGDGVQFLEEMLAAFRDFVRELKGEEPQPAPPSDPNPMRPFGETMIPLGPSTLLGLRGIYADGGDRIGLHVEVAEGTKRLPATVSACWDGRDPPSVSEILATIEDAVRRLREDPEPSPPITPYPLWVASGELRMPLALGAALVLTTRAPRKGVAVLRIEVWRKAGRTLDREVLLDPVIEADAELSLHLIGNALHASAEELR